MGRRRADSAAASAAKASRRATPAANDEPVGRHFKGRRHIPVWLKVISMVVSAALLVGIGSIGFVVWQLQNNVHTEDLNAAVTVNGNTKSPAEEAGSLQILILGTDTRAGSNSEYGTSADSSGYGQSDVMLLMNISADNSRVSVTSIPRDLMVPIPACKDPKSGTVYPAQPMAQLNSALNEAGPGCTVAAINEMTGLTIDHFMLADFTAVKELSTAVGGVQVCVDHAMYDNDGSGLRLPAGKSLVQGEQALAFLRTRHSFGDSSDLARIQAQQYFLGSLVRKITSDATLTNLPRLYSLAEAITKNVTIDKGLANIPSMLSIAARLSKIDPSQVAFVTVPNEAYVADPNRVQLMEPAAGQLFSALRNDAPLTKPVPTKTAKPSSSATPTATPSTAKATPTPTKTSAAPYDKAIQPITVVNNSAVPGRETALVAKLVSGGFTNTVDLGDDAAANETKVAFGADMSDVAADVAKLFNIPSTDVISDPTITGVQLRVGTDWVSGADYGKVTLPSGIVSSTAAEKNECLVVNPLYYTY